MKNEFVQTLEIFMSDYEGFDWEHGTIVLVKENRPFICEGVWKVLLDKFRDLPVRDWTHTDKIMVITLSQK